MKVNIYTIYDVVAKECGPIYQAKNHDVAVRAFRSLISDTPNVNVQDYDLYSLGERYVDKYWNKLYDMNTVTVRRVPMGLPRYYQKKLDYDGFLNYDSSKEVDFRNEVLEKNKGFLDELDEKVLSGVMSPSVALAEVDAFVDKAHNESLIVKETNLESKYSKKKRGSL